MIDEQFERDRVTSGEFRLIDFEAERARLDGILTQAAAPYGSYHPLEGNGAA